MTSEWDDTPWGGTTVHTVTTGTNVVRMLPAKAATGWQNIYTSASTPIAALSRSPLSRMRQEQALYWTHPWVRVAEGSITRRVIGIPWHLEDGNTDEEVDDTQSTPLRAVQGLLEKPQAALPARDRQPGIDTWTNLTKITSRHLGLCGMTHWYPDQVDNDGLPLALLYINPARMFPMTTTNGALLGWKLDPIDDWGRGGTFLKRDEVLTFYLEPPDSGGVSSGLVQAAWLKAQITIKGDSHYLESLSGGARLAGLISPKEGQIQDEQYGVLSNELRNVQESADSAKRLTIIRGPVDYNRTTATAQELDLSEYSAMTRSDILTIWGVPDSQTGIPAEAGLNSGGTKEADEAVMMQGAVHDRVVVIRDTVQTGLLDRWTATGIAPKLIIEEPTFDDRTPAFELAEKARVLPLTRNQRLAIIGEDPLPEYGPDGQPLGLAIDLPLDLRTVGQGEEPMTLVQGRFGNAPQPKPVVVNVTPPPFPPQLEPGEPAKALSPARLREQTQRKFEPVILRSVASLLDDQRREVAARIREKGEHIARKPTDKSVWWDAKRWDTALVDALTKGVSGLAATVATKIEGQLKRPAKAAFADSVASQILGSVARRVVNINMTTRDDIARVIGEGFAKGLAPAQVADLIEEATTFNEARAELIARTETALAYNEAAITSYREYEVERVEVIDGDSDAECAEANGQTWTLDEAEANPLAHPQCVRDFAPVFGAA